MMYLGQNAIGINNDNRDLKLISTVTITESLENDTTGNAIAIYNNYIKDIVSNITELGLILVIANNNLASNFALQKICVAPTDLTGSLVIRKSNNKYSTRSISNQTSAWCSAGTILDIYAIKEVTPNA